MEALTQFAPFILMFVVIYFFMIRPQQKRVKEEKAFEAGLKVGDRVILKSGLNGRINELNETTIVIETMSGKLLFERSSVSLELTKKLADKK